MAKINLYDRAMKILSSLYSDLALKLLFPDQVIEVLDRRKNVELNLPEKRVDFVQRIRIGGREYLLHVEFQFRFNRDVPKQAFVYSALLTEQSGLPVITVVLFLERTESELPDVYEVRVGDHVVHRFEYPVLKLWDYEKKIRSGNLRELAPLLALVSEKKDAEMLAQERALILGEKDAKKRADQLALAVMVASRYFDKQFLWDFFREEVAQMQTSTFIDDWIEEALLKGEQQGLQKGLKKGLQQGKAEDILSVLSLRNGGTPSWMEEKVRSIQDKEELDGLLKMAVTAPDTKAVEAYLMGTGRIGA